jgi:hypothetical protein
MIEENLSSEEILIKKIKSRRMRWEGHVARMGEERKVYKVLVGKRRGKRQFGRPRRTWEVRIRIDLRVLGRLAGGGVDSVGS